MAKNGLNNLSFKFYNIKYAGRWFHHFIMFQPDRDVKAFYLEVGVKDRGFIDSRGYSNIFLKI